MKTFTYYAHEKLLDLYNNHSSWDKIGIDLYEASSLRTYPWLSGAIIVPRDQEHFCQHQQN